MRNCKHCQKEFEPKKPKAIFCSAKCRVYYKRAKDRLNPPPKNKLAVIDHQEWNDSIYEQIKLIRAEKIPAERNTPIGKKVWQIDQEKRISELQKQLK